jgi:predicted amidohydrolase
MPCWAQFNFCIVLHFSLTNLQCYDIRFPELGISLRNKGAEILTYPSAFTFVTGSSHWETLLKCRAVETQCYVVAAAQTGAHNKKRTSYGHAMVC